MIRRLLSAAVVAIALVLTGAVGAAFVVSPAAACADLLC